MSFSIRHNLQNLNLRPLQDSDPTVNPFDDKTKHTTLRAISPKQNTDEFGGMVAEVAGGRPSLPSRKINPYYEKDLDKFLVRHLGQINGNINLHGMDDEKLKEILPEFVERRPLEALFFFSVKEGISPGYLKTILKDEYFSSIIKKTFINVMKSEERLFVSEALKPLLDAGLEYEKEFIFKVCEKSSHSILSDFSKLFKNKPYAEELLERATKETAEKFPHLLFSKENLDLIKDKKYTEEVLIKATKTFPVLAAKHTDEITNEAVKTNVINELAKAYVEQSPLKAFNEMFDKDIVHPLYSALRKNLALKRFADKEQKFEYVKDPLEKLIFKYITNDYMYTKRALNHVKDLINQNEGKETLKRAILESVKYDPEVALNYAELFIDEPYAKEVFLKVAKMPGKEYFVFDKLDIYKDKEFAKEVLIEALKTSPHVFALKYKEIKQLPLFSDIKEYMIKDHPGEILNIYDIAETLSKDEMLAAFNNAIKLDPFKALIATQMPTLKLGDSKTTKRIFENLCSVNPAYVYLNSHFFDHEEFAPDIKAKAETLCKYLLDVHNADGISERRKIINNIISGINPKIIEALDLVNKTHGLYIQPAGISTGKMLDSNNPFGFVFINGFENGNSNILRLEMSYEEILDLNNKNTKEIVSIFENKITKEKKDSLLHGGIFQDSDYIYDLPKDGSVDVMFTAVPAQLTGCETDIARLSQIYRTFYKGNITRACFENIGKWEETAEATILKNSSVPLKLYGATKKEILEQFELGLKEAIKNHKSTFVFHYLMHGSSTGMMAAKDELISANEIAEIISKKYIGRPISDQINISIHANSCFSGSQLNKIIEYLQDKKIPVKNLNISVDSCSDTPSWAGSSLMSTSLISDSMRGDNSETFDYYLSYYYEYVQDLQKNGKKLSPRVGTLGHAMQFADRMAYSDSPVKQDAQGYHYSTYTESGYFTQKTNESNMEEIKIADAAHESNPIKIAMTSFEKPPLPLSKKTVLEITDDEISEESKSAEEEKNKKNVLANLTSVIASAVANVKKITLENNPLNTNVQSVNSTQNSLQQNQNTTSLNLDTNLNSSQGLSLQADNSQATQAHGSAQKHFETSTSKPSESTETSNSNLSNNMNDFLSTLSTFLPNNIPKLAEKLPLTPQTALILTAIGVVLLSV